MSIWQSLKEAVFLNDPIKGSLADLRKRRRPLHDLETKLHIDQFNRQQVVSLIQLVVSLCLVVLTVILIYVTSTLRGETKMLNQMMPMMTPPHQVQ